jgi:glycosyltransferase involved in cell wall biosynthesis
MTTNIGVSIIIPMYNGVEFLSNAIESIQSQTYKFWEVIVGVNGHSEESDVYQHAYKYHQIKDDIWGSIIVKLYHTKGKVNTSNEMIKDCGFDTICILDVDDYWLPKKLEKQIDIWRTGKYDVVGTFCRYFGEHSGYPKIPGYEIDNTIFMTGNPIINSSAMIRKSDALWSDQFKGLDDYDMWLRLSYEGKKFYNVPEFLTFHRIHKQSAFNNTNYNYVPQLLEYWRAKMN